jgi:hypothetical protein
MTRSNVYNLLYGWIAIVASLVVAVGLLRLPGCLGEATGTVTGNVNFKGKPLPEGWITFFDRDGNGYRTFIHPDGSYTLSNIPRGTVKIAVEARKRAVPDGPATDPVRPYRHIPRRYSDADKSGLSLTVSAGPQDSNIDLKDDFDDSEIVQP